MLSLFCKTKNTHPTQRFASFSTLKLSVCASDQPVTPEQTELVGGESHPKTKLCRIHQPCRRHEDVAGVPRSIRYSLTGRGVMHRETAEKWLLVV
uniref:Uncharacterized protein n=3 Tax=Helianthus annuus TaxID=4232 RepID=A0A251T3S0_HELAN